MNQTLRLVKSLIKLRWKILPPRRANVLLYFLTGADVIKPYFAKNELRILDLREREVNIFVALLCLIDRDLSAQNYAIRYIGIVKPKLVLTFIDNFPPFFQLKNRFPEIQTMLIQNGIRSERGDLFGRLLDSLKLESNHVDQMFVFGRAVGTLYSKYISGEIVPIGSFKNNSVPISATESKSIAYVSTYRPGISKDFVVPDSSPSNPVTYQQITARRERVIIYVAEYCKKHQKQFVIVGKDEDFSEENLYYQKLLENYPWKLEPRLTSMNSYEVLNKSEIVVFTSSTLGYEALARGKKTAAFLIDAKLLDAQALRFGWPAVVADEGKFWTHQIEEKRFAEILDYLTSVSQSDWEQTCSETMNDIITYDANNSQFVEMVQSLRADW
jgi:surface carbohydrate biosynthesis protein